jgi:hypothetical protein
LLDPHPIDAGDERSAAQPYTDDELDATVLRTQRSDRLQVATRLLVLAAVFWFMGRAIVRHDLTAGFLLLPLALELILVMWIGLVLARFFVDCEVFGRTARAHSVIAWTALTAALISILLAIEEGTFRLARIVPGWRDGWRTVLETGLVWALVAEGVGLILSTAAEVRRWRRAGGVFVWASIFDVGVRFAMVIVVGIVAVVLLMLASDATGGRLFEQPRRSAWIAWAFLLCVEVAGLVVGVKYHRDLQRAAAKHGAAPAAR